MSSLLFAVYLLTILFQTVSLKVMKTIIRPHRMHAVHRCGLLLQMQRGLYVSVHRLVTGVSLAKTTEPINMPFRIWTRGAQETIHFAGPG